MTLETGGYQIILADPPWRYGFSRSKGRGIESKYPTMKLEDIKALDVQSLCAAEGAVLFLWATAPKLPEALEVMAAWGFDYITNDVWVKLPPDRHRAQLSLADCMEPEPSRRMGMGYWYRQRHEHILLGRSRKFSPPDPARRFESVFFDNIAKHSRKPPIARQRIEAMFPEARRVELFAREGVAGWDAWGNTIGNSIDLRPKAADGNGHGKASGGETADQSGDSASGSTASSGGVE